KHPFKTKPQRWSARGPFKKPTEPPNKATASTRIRWRALLAARVPKCSPVRRWPEQTCFPVAAFSGLAICDIPEPRLYDRAGFCLPIATTVEAHVRPTMEETENVTVIFPTDTISISRPAWGCGGCGRC